MTNSLILLATRNQHKLREAREIFRAAGVGRDQSRPYELRGLDDYPDAPEVAEDHETFAENARAKAAAIAQHTGCLTIADDSGLEVDALGGAPGVQSSRFAGPDDAARIAKLLDLMRGVPRAKRTARFRCAVVIVSPDGECTVVEGVCEGRITEAPRGEKGFGYDPVFVPRGCRRTFAQMTAAEKNRRSHRGQAFRAAAQVLARMMRSEPGRPRS